MTKKVQLIRPPLDSWYSDQPIGELVSAPIGLCILASELEELQLSVEIIDGLDRPLAYSLDKIDAEFVGVTSLYSCHSNALAVLKKAKAQNSITVMGGPNVNYLAERILKNHTYVDYIVVGDGEDTLTSLVAGVDSKVIPNLMYRENGKVKKNKISEVAMKTIFDIDSVIDKRLIDPKNAFPISSIRGCIKATRSGRCSFCSIRHSLKIMSPLLVWKQVSLLNEKYGLEYFFETGDSFIIPGFINRLLSTRPKELSHVSFRVYASPDQLTRETVIILKKLNVREIFLGLESVSDFILKSAGKSYDKEDVLRAVRLLDEFGILIQVPFMVGLPGETRVSMQESFAFANILAARRPQLKILSSFAIPLPGTKLFEMLINNSAAKEEYRGDLEKDDNFDFQALVKLLLKYETEATFDDINEVIAKTKRIGKASASFGIN